MTFISPATKSGPLFDLIGRYLEGGTAPDPLALARMRREASDVLKNANAATGHLLFSGIAALEWDQEAALSHVAKAMEHDNSLDTYMNAIVTFGALGRPDLAELHANLAASCAPSRADVINETSAVLISLGRVKDAAEMQISCLRLNPSAEFEINALTLSEVMEEVGISEEWLGDELKIAHAVLFDTRTRIREFHYSGDNDPDGGPSLNFEFGFVGSLEDEFLLDDEIAARLANTDRWNPARLSVHTRYMSAEEDAVVTI